MPDKPVPKPRADEFARRAASRLAEEDPAAGRIARFDPAWIALCIAIMRLLILLLGPEAAPAEIARLKAPRWWQWIALGRRHRLLTEARRHLNGLAGTSNLEPRRSLGTPKSLADASLDAALDTAANSSPDDLRAIAREVQP